MSYDLKSCPFCGSEPELNEWHDKEIITFQISCENENCTCRPFTENYGRILPVIEAWNRRADNDR